MDTPRDHRPVHRLPTPIPRLAAALSMLAILLLLVAACGDSDDGEATPSNGATDNDATDPGVDDQAESDSAPDLSDATITVYSGREEDLIAPLFDAFEEATGATVEARYDGSAEMALLIDTEGDQSRADVVILQSPGAIGFLDGNGRLAPLGQSTLDRLDPKYRAADGNWAGITGRVRVLVYNTDNVSQDELPESVLDLTNELYEGRVGVAPGNGSFQDFVSAMRVELGDDTTADWLEGMAANDSPNYAKNSAIVDAVGRGEVDMGLVNHYYLEEALEEDPDLAAANHVFPEGDLGSLLIVSAAAVVDTSDDAAAGEALIAYLLSDEAQEISAAGEKEYPLVAGVPAPEGLEPLQDLAAVQVDFDLLGEGFSGTQDLIENSGIVE